MIDSKIYKYMEKATNNNNRIISRLCNQMNQLGNKLDHKKPINVY